VVLFLGRFVVSRVPVLKQLSIPAPVVGGGLVALLLALADAVLHARLGFNMGLKDTLLLMFFTTVGHASRGQLVLRRLDAVEPGRARRSPDGLATRRSAERVFDR